MIIGVGIDIQEIGKITRSIENAAFVRKVFTPAEVALCSATRSPGEHFSGKFALKEAFMKAIGAGIRQGVWFTDIEVLNAMTGAPYLQLHREAQQLAAKNGVTFIFPSISHSAGIAVAVVILTGS
jgi:holo-[acyl-carrier protein] synthase